MPEAVIGKAAKPSASGKGFEARVLEFKREIVQAALADARGNFVEAARILEVTPSYMRRLARNLALS